MHGPKKRCDMCDAREISSKVEVMSSHCYKSEKFIMMHACHACHACHGRLDVDHSLLNCHQILLH